MIYKFLIWLFRNILGPLADRISIGIHDPHECRPANPWLPMFLFAALTVRLAGFNTPSIWYDEAISYFRAGLPFAMALTNKTDLAAAQDIGPNLWETVLRVFRVGPLWIFRLPSLLCAMAALWLAWLIMDELKFPPRARLVSCVILAALPGLIWISQDARFYSAIVFLAAAGTYLALTRRWLLFGLVTAALAYVHPTAPAYGLAPLVLAWSKCGKDDRKKLSLITAGLAALWIFRYVGSITNRFWDGFWLGPFGNIFYIMYSTAQAFFVNTLPGGWWLIAVFVFIIAVLIVSAFDKRATVPWILTLTPLAAIIFVCIVYKNIYFYRPLMPVLFPFALLFGQAFAPGDRLRSWVIPGLGLFLLVVALANWNPANRGGYIDRAAETIRAGWQPGDRIIYSDGLAAIPFEFYLGDIPACMVLQDHDAPDDYLPTCTDGLGRTWLILSPKDIDLDTIDAIRIETIDKSWQFPKLEIYLAR